MITSADGTRIAAHTTGDGPAIVIVNGALSRAQDAAEIAAAMADAGLRAITYDRRARGDSGHTPPAAPEREADILVRETGLSAADAHGLVTLAGRAEPPSLSIVRELAHRVLHD